MLADGEPPGKRTAYTRSFFTPAAPVNSTVPRAIYRAFINHLCCRGVLFSRTVETSPNSARITSKSFENISKSGDSFPIRVDFSFLVSISFERIFSLSLCVFVYVYSSGGSTRHEILPPVLITIDEHANSALGIGGDRMVLAVSALASCKSYINEDRGVSSTLGNRYFIESARVSVSFLDSGWSEFFGALKKNSPGRVTQRPLLDNDGRKRARVEVFTVSSRQCSRTADPGARTQGVSHGSSPSLPCRALPDTRGKKSTDRWHAFRFAV